MIKPCILKKWNVQESIKHSLVSIQAYRSYKLQGSASRTSLQIDMQNVISPKSDLLATTKKKKKKKKEFSPKFEIPRFYHLSENFFSLSPKSYKISHFLCQNLSSCAAKFWKRVRIFQTFLEDVCRIQMFSRFFWYFDTLQTNPMSVCL